MTPATGATTSAGGDSRKRAVIHIGLGKTGSTTLQRSLYTHRRWLLQHGVLYPSLAENLSAHLPTMFRDTAPKILPLIDPRAEDDAQVPRLRREYQEALESEINGAAWGTLVISAEGLSNALAPEVARFKAWVDTLRCDVVDVVVFVREPTDWARSFMQQRLKTGETLDDLVRSPTPPNWRRRLSPWIDSFGRERMTVLAFEDAKRDGILTTFCRAVAIPQPEPEPIPANESMSMEASLILSHLNRVRPLFQDGKRSNGRRWVGNDRLGEIPGSRFVLPQATRTALLEMARDDVAWLNQTFGLSLYDQTPQEQFVPDAPPAWSAETLDALAILLSDLGNGWEAAMEHDRRPAVPDTRPASFLGRVRRRVRARYSSALASQGGPRR